MLKDKDEVIDQSKCFICKDKIIEHTEFLKCNCCEHLYHFDCIAKEESENIKNNSNNSSSTNDNGLNSPLLSNSIVNSQTIKNWICSKCYEMTSQPSFYEISKEDKEEKDQIRRKFDVDSYEKYAKKFKNDYFSLSICTESIEDKMDVDQKNIEVRMDVDQKEENKDDNSNINNDDKRERMKNIENNNSNKMETKNKNEKETMEKVKSENVDDNIKETAKKDKNETIDKTNKETMEENKKETKDEIKKENMEDSKKETTNKIKNETLKNIEIKDEIKKEIVEDNKKENTKKEEITVEAKKQINLIKISEQEIEKEFWKLMNEQSDMVIKSGDHLINEKYGR